MNRKIIFAITFCFITLSASSQIIDKIVAVVGDEVVLMSDIETQYLQYLASGNTEADAVRCQIIEDVLYQKLLAHQAKVDSTDVGEDEVNKELERRLGSFVSQLYFGILEEYYGKSILDIKTEFYDIIYNPLLSQRMQSAITANVKITPAEVNLFYSEIEKSEILSKYSSY